MKARSTVLLIVAALAAIAQADDRASVGAVEADAVLLPSRSVKLSLPMEATLRELRVKEGDFVKKGDLLAVLYSPAEALDRDRAVKELELAHFQLKVSDKLRADAIVSEEQAREKRIDHDVAALNAQRAEALLADKTVVAPFDGCVLRVFKEQGETVARVEKIVELVDFATLYAESYLESQWLGTIRRGSTAQVQIPQLGEGTRDAIVENVDPVADPASGLFRVRLVIDNSDYSIPSGVPAKARFTPGSMLGAAKPEEEEAKPGSN
jgi:membrane fusion protein (multidrug efflux system)